MKKIYSDLEIIDIIIIEIKIIIHLWEDIIILEIISDMEN